MIFQRNKKMPKLATVESKFGLGWANEAFRLPAILGNSHGSDRSLGRVGSRTWHRGRLFSGTAGDGWDYFSRNGFGYSVK